MRLIWILWSVFAGALAAGMWWENQLKPEFIYLQGWSPNEPPERQCAIIYRHGVIDIEYSYHVYRFVENWYPDSLWTPCPDRKQQ